VNLLLVAHGTRDSAGAVVTERVAQRARDLLGVPVGVGYADVRRPTPAEALAALPGPTVAVPMFLAAGYHVRVDVPEQLRATGRPDVLLAGAFGPDPLLAGAAADRLAAAGAEPSDTVVLAVAASSDPHALADSATAARLLGRPVVQAPIVLRGPGGVADVVARLRAEGAERVAVASWLLAPGLFQRNLEQCGADAVAAPLADHPAVPAVLGTRYEAAMEAARSA
jgi:sirohydrochlorin ferrochelatase